jgi:PAS domain S-box-containing protein
MTDRADSKSSAAVQAQLQSELEQTRRQLAKAERGQAVLKRQLAARSQELELSRSRLRSMVDYAPNFVHIVDTDLRVTFINRGGNQFRPQDIIGTKVGDHMESADRRRVQRRLRQVIKTAQPTRYEFTSMGENGTLAWYHTTAGPIGDRGQVTGLVLSTFDITEDRYRTEALREGKRVAEAARSRDRALLNSIGEGLVVINERGKIADINPPAALMLGYEQEELIGQWFPSVVQALDNNGNEIHPLDRPALRALSGGEAVSEVIRYRRKDGSQFPAAVTISPVVLDDRPIGAVEVFRDLTGERELEQAKEEFVALASHQLRTPATGVKAYISMLLDGYTGNLTTQQQAFLEKVFQSNERQLQIINDMLRVARMDSGRVVPELASTDLARLVRDVVEEQRPTIRGRKQTLKLELPSAKVEGVVDAKLVRMALENVVSNASKYTPEGGCITLGLEGAAATVRIVIRDTGVGINKADLPRLFKRFSRIDNPLSTQRGGTGLGLYLAQNVVALHYGRMLVDSIPGEGTVFTIELPLGSTAPATILHPASQGRRS